jgi:hypothetical protein
MPNRIQCIPIVVLNGPRERLAAERQLIQDIKQRKLQEMEASGIPTKYRAELERKSLVDW